MKGVVGGAPEWGYYEAVNTEAWWRNGTREHCRNMGREETASHNFNLMADEAQQRTGKVKKDLMLYTYSIKV